VRASSKTPNGAELLTILGTEFHVERRESYYKAQFIDLDGKRQVILIGRELFTYPSKVVAQLLKANATLPDDPNAAVKVVKRALANRSKKSRRITIRAGWHESSFVYPGETFGPLAGVLEHVGVDEIDPALGLKKGTPEGWREGLRKAFEASDYLIFAASVAFSGRLFELAGEQEGTIFHFQPQDSPAALADFKTKSSSGKTLSARCANSTIGRARKTDLVSFAVTARALEDYCFTHHHLFAALDEEGRALVSTGKHIKPSQLPYQVTSGRGTLYSKKATRDPEFRNLTWLLPVITTGEKPLDDPKSQRVRAEGAQVRMAPIPVPPGAVGGIINRLGGTRDEIVRRAHVLARKVEKTLDENYGVAMPAYLKLLVPRRSSLKRYVRRTIDSFVKWVRADSDPWERRLAEKFGIVLAAAILASKFGIAPWAEKRAANAVRTIYRLSRAALASVTEASDALAGRLRKALAAGRFPQLDKGAAIKPEDAAIAWGVTRKLTTHGQVVLITLHRLQRILKPRTIASAVVSELTNRGILIESRDGKTAHEIMMRGLHGSTRRRYVALKLGALL
jgi:putative DNA primase/helicase